MLPKHLLLIRVLVYLVNHFAEALSVSVRTCSGLLSLLASASFLFLLHHGQSEERDSVTGHSQAVP